MHRTFLALLLIWQFVLMSVPASAAELQLNLRSINESTPQTGRFERNFNPTTWDAPDTAVSDMKARKVGAM